MVLPPQRVLSACWYNSLCTCAASLKGAGVKDCICSVLKILSLQSTGSLIHKICGPVLDTATSKHQLSARSRQRRGWLLFCLHPLPKEHQKSQSWTLGGTDNFLDCLWPGTQIWSSSHQSLNLGFGTSCLVSYSFPSDPDPSPLKDKRESLRRLFQDCPLSTGQGSPAMCPVS